MCSCSGFQSTKSLRHQGRSWLKQISPTPFWKCVRTNRDACCALSEQDLAGKSDIWMSFFMQLVGCSPSKRPQWDRFFRWLGACSALARLPKAQLASNGTLLECEKASRYYTLSSECEDWICETSHTQNSTARLGALASTGYEPF